MFEATTRDGDHPGHRSIDQLRVPSPHVNYRPDIDGLRAIAVLAVVGYHAYPGAIKGGLVGVDIFFVISGYLISTIILKGLLAGRFSYLDFYVRRIKRIFPALALVLLTCLIAGWFFLYDLEYRPLGRHVAGGAAFISNFLLSNEAGYFDSRSEFKELLHLWSLGVEEQFYLIFPLLLALVWKWTRTLLPLIATLLVVSFALNVWLIGLEPAQTFYFPFTRFWELMIGATLAYVSQVSMKGRPDTAVLPAGVWPDACAWTGALLLLAALYFINQDSAFPGWFALLPTLGALLLITAGPAASINKYVLSSPPLVFVGLISYPLYLWHWPILSFVRLLSAESPGRITRALMIVLSFVLAWITYRIVEKPIRTYPRPAIAAVLCAIMLAIGCAGLFIDTHDGLPFRAANTRNGEGRKLFIDSLALDTEIRTKRYKLESCEFLKPDTMPAEWCTSYGPHDGKIIVVWGDSHAAAWSPVFYAIADANHLRVIRFSMGGCPPLVETRRIDAVFASAPCASFGQAEKVVKLIATLRPERIFILGRWSLYKPTKVAAQHPQPATGARSNGDIVESQLTKTLAALPADVPITVFRTAPVLKGDPERGLLRHTKIETTGAEYQRAEASANRALDAAVATRNNASLFDPATILCSKVCSPVVNGTVVYANETHLSAQGALLALDAVSNAYFPIAIH